MAEESVDSVMDEIIASTDVPKIKLNLEAIKEAIGDNLDIDTMRKFIDKFKIMSEKMKLLSAEERSDMYDKIREKLVGSVKDAILERNSVFGMFTPNILVFIVAVLIVLILFVFFGYKLYKSLTEKERKRDEKKKLKQQKKRK